jgi:hypothetical protein
LESRSSGSRERERDRDADPLLSSGRFGAARGGERAGGDAFAGGDRDRRLSGDAECDGLRRRRGGLRSLSSLASLRRRRRGGDGEEASEREGIVVQAAEVAKKNQSPRLPIYLLILVVYIHVTNVPRIRLLTLVNGPCLPLPQEKKKNNDPRKTLAHLFHERPFSSSSSSSSTAMLSSAETWGSSGALVCKERTSKGTKQQSQI